jgi:glycosyltransferase involved in cell wall biosynthesis
MASKHIGETIQSVLDSTYSNIEIIVNDDASTDVTRETVQAFEDSRIQFFQNEINIGIPRNWNKALKYARGDFIGLLNHDDLIGPFWLSYAAYVFEKYPHIGWVSTAFQIIDEQRNVVELISRFPETREYSREEVFRFVAGLDGLGPTYIARREALEAAGFYNDYAGPAADNDLFLRLSICFPFFYSTYPHAAWRLHKNNLTHRWGVIQQTIDGFNILNRIFSNDLPDELINYKKECYQYWLYKTLIRAQNIVKKGDLVTYHKLIRILSKNSYLGK